MYNNFIVEGEKIVLELLGQPNIEIVTSLCTQEWLDKKGAVEREFASKVLIAKAKEMDQITALKTATPVMVVAKKQNNEEDKNEIEKNLSIYLDKIQNPGNFGTILRIADWFGISTVFCSSDSADLYNPKVIQATMGAFLRVSVIKKSFPSIKESYPDLAVYGTVLEGKNLFETPLNTSGIIVIGSEGKGISAEIREYLTHPITIPAHSEGGAESLNAAVATGIVCAAFRNLKILMPMSDKKPLDIDEVVPPEKESKPTRKGSLLELIPITMIVIGLYLKNQGKPWASEMMILGGALASLFYLLFSWYMFKVAEYKRNEVIISILVGLIFPIGILGLVFYYESWAYATQLINVALIGAAVLFVGSLIFLLSISKMNGLPFL